MFRDEEKHVEPTPRVNVNAIFSFNDLIYSEMLDEKFERLLNFVNLNQ